ncbi:hypothetical protein SDC9_157002 [bioreactor metagenome]|uniref:Uncharacterized protein n=1 Tax=bioreactor metagenome TaxID=1076179 RepID=A0A645F752_9ZZZZ
MARGDLDAVELRSRRERRYELGVVRPREQLVDYILCKRRRIGLTYLDALASDGVSSGGIRKIGLIVQLVRIIILVCADACARSE